MQNPFKVGDRFRVIISPYEQVPPGSTGTVTRVFNPNVTAFCVWTTPDGKDAMGWPFTLGEIELVEGAESPAEGSST